MRQGDSVVFILWHSNPFRGDKFEDQWRPACEAALDYGATSWSWQRSKDDPNDFVQMAVWPSKEMFDRYWYSEEIAEARAEASGLYQVPVLPQWLRVIDGGAVEVGEPQSS